MPGQGSKVAAGSGQGQGALGTWAGGASALEFGAASLGSLPVLPPMPSGLTHTLNLNLHVVRDFVLNPPHPDPWSM